MHVLTAILLSLSVLCAVMLMSLRAQLQAPPNSTRPIIAAQLNTDNLHDASRCNVLLWVPRSNGTQFLAGHASGNIIVYKKVSTTTAWCMQAGQLVSLAERAQQGQQHH